MGQFKQAPSMFRPSTTKPSRREVRPRIHFKPRMEQPLCVSCLDQRTQPYSRVISTLLPSPLAQLLFPTTQEVRKLPVSFVLVFSMKTKNSLNTVNQPESVNMRPIPKLSDDQWVQLGKSAYQLVDQNLGQRTELDASLDYGNALYEMMGERANPPWEGAANIPVPIVATAIEEMTSRLVGSALVPRPYTVSGKDSISTQYAHIVEQFYNGEFGKNSWYDAMDTCIHLAARDGTSILEVLWEKKISQTAQMIDGPVIGEDGQPQLDEYQQPIIKKQKQMVQKIEWDAVRYAAVELRDFVLIPNYAPSIEAANGVARKRYMSEKDMYAMVNAGVFDKEQVEYILNFVAEGQDERTYDRQGNWTYTIGGKIDIGDNVVSDVEGVHVSRGPVQMWQILTDQYDLDGDGVCEENYIWIHDSSQRMAGFAPFEYEGGRNYFPLSLMPRPNRFYGFSVPDRVGHFQEEATAQKNANLDWLDLASNPNMYVTDGFQDKGDDNDHRMGPGKTWHVQTPTDVGFIQLGNPPEALMREVPALQAQADRSIGAPQTSGIPSGQSGGGKQSARAAQQAAALQGMQTNRMIVLVRKWMQAAFNYTHMLYVKYGKDQMSMMQTSQQGSVEVAVPREILAQNYILGVAGLGGPLDKEARRQDAMALYQTFMGNPLVQGNIEHVYNLSRNLMEQFDYPDTTGFLGTLEEAKQQQAMQQAQQQEQQKNQMAMELLSHASIVPKTNNGGGQFEGAQDPEQAQNDPGDG